MKIQYLGTAAAEGIPALFCECDTCMKARQLGGKNIRTRSQAIINDELLIDFPADTYMHFLNHRIPLEKIKNCLITHSHADHLYASDIAMRKPGFSHLKDEFPMVFYSDKSGFDKINAVVKTYGVSDKTVIVKKVKLNQPTDVDAYSVTALRATHDPDSSPVVYLVEHMGKTLFYSNDTGEYPPESMRYLETLKKPIDLVSFDCTEACNDSTYMGHLSFGRCIELRKKLVDIGAADAHTVFVLNHFSHNGKNVLYEDFKEIAAKYGFEVSYDGMVIEF